MSSGMYAIIFYSNSFPFSPPLLYTLTLFLLLTPFPPTYPPHAFSHISYTSFNIYPLLFQSSF